MINQKQEEIVGVADDRIKTLEDYENKKKWEE